MMGDLGDKTPGGARVRKTAPPFSLSTNPPFALSLPGTVAGFWTSLYQPPLRPALPPRYGGWILDLV